MNIKDTIYENTSYAYNSVVNAAGNTTEKLKGFISGLVGETNQNNNDYYPTIEDVNQNNYEEKNDNIN